MPDLKSWREDFRRWGVIAGLYRRLMIALKPRLVLCGVYARPIDPHAPLPQPPPGLTVRIATAAELHKAGEDPSMDLPGDVVGAALERGDICVATFDGDCMVAYMWRSFTNAPHREGLWVHFEKPYRYGYKAYTRPQYRGRHLSDPMGHYLDPYCIERGFTHSIGFIETHNYPSIRSDKRRGSRLVGWTGYLMGSRGARPFRSPGARRHGFGFFRYPKDTSSGDAASAVDARERRTPQ